MPLLLSTGVLLWPEIGGLYLKNQQYLAETKMGFWGILVLNWNWGSLVNWIDSVEMGSYPFLFLIKQWLSTCRAELQTQMEKTRASKPLVVVLDRSLDVVNTGSWKRWCLSFSTTLLMETGVSNEERLRHFCASETKSKMQWSCSDSMGDCRQQWSTTTATTQICGVFLDVD